jgi:hypothetical protein
VLFYTDPRVEINQAPLVKRALKKLHRSIHRTAKSRQKREVLRSKRDPGSPRNWLVSSLYVAEIVFDHRKLLNFITNLKVEYMRLNT